jgi:hypothetical protein
MSHYSVHPSDGDGHSRASSQHHRSVSQSSSEASHHDDERAGIFRREGTPAPRVLAPILLPPRLEDENQFPRLPDPIGQGQQRGVWQYVRPGAPRQPTPPPLPQLVRQAQQALEEEYVEPDLPPVLPRQNPPIDVVQVPQIHERPLFNPVRPYAMLKAPVPSITVVKQH